MDGHSQRAVLEYLLPQFRERGASWSDEAKLSGYVRGYRYITKKGFRFPFGDYFGIAIDNHDDTHVVWGEGMNYQSPGSIWYAGGR